MNLRLSNLENSQSRNNEVMSYLHQCKQCGLLFERNRKAAASDPKSSWDRKFMVDKCDMCKNFRLYNVCS